MKNQKLKQETSCLAQEATEGGDVETQNETMRHQFEESMQRCHVNVCLKHY